MSMLSLSSKPESIKPQKPFPFEKFPKPVFSMLFEFIDADSITNLQRGSNRAIFSLCGETLKYTLEKMRVFTLDNLRLVHPLRPQLNFRTACCTFGTLFGHTPNLNRLNFENTDKTKWYSPGFPLPENRLKQVFSALKERCPRVTSISIKNCNYNQYDVRYKILPFLSPNLTSLDIEGTACNYEEFAFFEKIGNKYPHLEHLNLNFCSGNNWGTNSALRALLGKCKKLQTLHLKDFGKIDDEAANYISQCTELTDLDLEGAMSMGSRDIQKIVESCKKLTCLNVRGISIDDEAMGAIARCNQLTQLVLGSFDLGPFEILSNCLQLKLIDIYFCEDISSCSRLAKCTKLERLTITNCKISKIDFENLRKALPNVKLHLGQEKS